MHRYEMSRSTIWITTYTRNDFKRCAHFRSSKIKLKKSCKRVVNLTLEVYKDFGLENYSFRLSYGDPADTKKYYADDDVGKSTRYVKRS